MYKVVLPKFTLFLAEKGLFNIIPADCTKFLTKLSTEIISRRRQKLEVRTDFIQNMIDHELKDGEQKSYFKPGENASNGTSTKWTKPLKKTLSDNEILSQTILFLAAGYETTATTLGLLAYNLAMNPQYQDKVIEEVDRVLQKHVNHLVLILCF